MYTKGFLTPYARQHSDMVEPKHDLLLPYQARGLAAPRRRGAFVTVPTGTQGGDHYNRPGLSRLHTRRLDPSYLSIG